MLWNASSSLVPDRQVCLPFPEPKQGKPRWTHTGQKFSKTTRWLRYTTNDIALLHLFPLTIVLTMKKPSFNKCRKNLPGPDQVWSLKWQLSPAHQGPPRRERKPSPLHSAASEMLNVLSSSLNSVVRKGLHHVLPVQEYITSIGIHFNKQQPSAPRITDG